MNKTIAVLPGDGIGPEIMAEAVKVLRRVEVVFGHKFDLQEGLIGGAAFENLQNHFPKVTQRLCESADAILFGSVGGPAADVTSRKWKDCEKNSILGIRKHFDFNINLRPIRVYQSLRKNCPVRLKDNAAVDILCVRELSEGIYFGEHSTSGTPGNRVARDVMEYRELTIEAAARAAFEAAALRNGKVTSVDKANVLDCSRLWRDVVDRVSLDYPDCRHEHLLVDNCAMQVILHPEAFDVLLLPNMFGDIISDELSVLSGSLGMLPSASMNREGKGMYEPSGGSAHDIAGKGIVNPAGQILSAALMLKHSFGLVREHDAIVNAVEETLDAGYVTRDLSPDNYLKTSEFGDHIAEAIRG